MIWQETPYAVLLIATAALPAVLAISAWRRPSIAGATSMTMLMLGVTVWSLGYALQLTNDDLSVNVFWGKVKYGGTEFKISFMAP